MTIEALPADAGGGPATGAARARPVPAHADPALANVDAEHSGRISRLRHSMDASRVSAVALASPENIYYLTGLDHLGYFAFTLLVVPAAGVPTLITRAMERPTIRAQVPWCRHLSFSDGEPPGGLCARAVAEAAATGATGAAGEAGEAVALEQESTFFPPAIAGAIRSGVPGVRWSSASDLLARQRAVKSSSEIGHVRRAALISDVAMRAGIAAARHDADERDVAAEVYRAMITAGGEPPGFAPLIRPTTILDQEHVSWSARRIRRGQGMFFELSGSACRYHAPQSRIVYIGQAPDGAAEAADAALAGLLAAQ
ncbi:MAG: aminopeptidase P family protein, partial [Nocardiopsaceae bacterium]|nr:aminopeptidase P family protein [Nocardiopsaceae bacterium]